jgi:hypothetical protein
LARSLWVPDTFVEMLQLLLPTVLLVFFELGAMVYARDLLDVNRRLVELDVGRLKCLRYDPRNGEITEQLSSPK